MSKRNLDTTLSRVALWKLAEYIASRRDLDNAEPREIEAALKKAGKIPATGDHYYTAYHAGLKAMRIQREKVANSEWVYLETRGAGTDEVRGLYQHTPCGTVLTILQGHMARLCPKCHPEQWGRTHPSRD